MTFIATRPDALVLTRGRLHPLPAGLLSADIDYDLCEKLTDPAHRPEVDMLNMTGLQPEVRAFVLATRGAEQLLDEAVPQVIEQAAMRFVVVMFACAGGL